MVTSACPTESATIRNQTRLGVDITCNPAQTRPSKAELAWRHFIAVRADKPRVDDQTHLDSYSYPRLFSHRVQRNNRSLGLL